MAAITAAFLLISCVGTTPLGKSCPVWSVVAVQKVPFGLHQMLPESWTPIIQSAASQYDLDPNLMAAQLTVESGGNQNAVSPKGAQGGAQLMPATAQSLGVDDPTDPNQFIPAQAKLMRENLDRYDGDTVMALKAYHGGTNQKNWGPQTNAYPNKVLAAHQRLTSMNNGIVTSPLLPPGSELYPDQGDGRGSFYLTPDGRMIPPGQMNPSYSPPTPGADYAPDGDNSAPGPSLDTSQYPQFGNARQQVATNLQQPPQQPAAAGGAPGAGGVPPGLFSDTTTDINSDPTYGPLARKAAWAGAFGNQGLIGGFLAGQAGVMKNRIDNNLLAQRAMMAYGTPLARMVQAGVPEDTARSVLGMPPNPSGQGGYSAKPMAPQDISKEQDDLKQYQQLNTNRARLDVFRKTIKSGGLTFYPGVGMVSDARLGLDAYGVPVNSTNAQNYKSFRSTMEGIRQDNLGAAAGVQTDKDAENEMNSLMPNLTNTRTVENHLNNLVNNYDTREQQVKARINERRVANKQPPMDWKSIDATNPASQSYLDPSTLLANPYANHQQQQAPVGSGGIGVTSKGTKYRVIGQ